MTTSRAATLRARNRADLVAEIVGEARRQLASGGVDSVSLRAVARELGMVSSAVYRYLASREDLLTILIAEARASVIDAVAAATASEAAASEAVRWTAGWSALRAWALSHPHEYTLVFGPAITGFGPSDGGRDGGGSWTAGLGVLAARPNPLAWAQLHGLIAMELAGRWPRPVPDPGALFHRAVRATVDADVCTTPEQGGS